MVLNLEYITYLRKQLLKKFQTNENDLHHDQNHVEDHSTVPHDVRAWRYVISSWSERLFMYIPVPGIEARGV